MFSGEAYEVTAESADQAELKYYAYISGTKCFCSKDVCLCINNPEVQTEVTELNVDI